MSLLLPFIILSYLCLSNGAQCPIIAHCKCDGLIHDRFAFTCNGTSLKETTAQLPNNTKWYSYAAKEMVVDLGSTDFSHLYWLQRLYIHSSKDGNLRFIKPLARNEAHIFKAQNDLRVLTINLIWQFEIPLPELFAPLKQIRSIDLSGAMRMNISALIQSLYGLEDKIHFNSLFLPNVQILDHAVQQCLNLTELLHPLRNCPIQTLDISNNALQEIYPGLNTYGGKIQNFLANNNLLPDVLHSGIIIDILLHKGITQSQLQYQGYGKERSQNHAVSIESKQLSFKRKANRPKIISSHTSITEEMVQDYKISQAMNRCIKNAVGNVCHIFAKQCDATRKMLNESHTFLCSVLYTYLPKYFVGIPCKVIPPFSELVDLDCAGCLVIPSTGRLHACMLHNLNIYDDINIFASTPTEQICFHSNTKITLIDLSFSRDRGYDRTAMIMEMNIRGLRHLKILKMAQVSLKTLHVNLGNNFPNLEYLDISDNMLNLDGSIFERVFQGFRMLKSLQMSSNSIKNINRNMFSSLNRLTTLNLSNNAIEEFEADLRNLTSLKTLDLSKNLISTLSTSTMDDLNYLATRVQQQLTVDLSGTNLICTCQTKDFLQWALQTEHHNISFLNMENTFCVNQYSNRVQLSSVDLNDIIRECRGELYYVLITTAITVPLSFIFFGGMVFTYKKRWWFRYQYFLAQQVWRNYKTQEDFNMPYQYDVFVSYNQRDQDWIDDILQPTLENDHNFKLCLHHRDFMFGEIITEQIITSIENSRKTLLILSPNFLASTWCQFEMEMARNKLFATGKDVLLLALLRSLPKTGVSKTLKTLLERKTYIEWSEDEFGQKLFWGKLLDAIKAPREQPYDLDYPEAQQYEEPDENTRLLQRD